MVNRINQATLLVFKLYQDSLSLSFILCRQRRPVFHGNHGQKSKLLKVYCFSLAMTFSKSLAREAVNKLVDRERLRFVQTKNIFN